MRKAPIFGAFFVSGLCRRSGIDEIKSVFEHAEHAFEIVSALHDQAARRDDAIGALLARETQILLDPVERIFARAPVDGENGLVAQQIDRVIAPCSRRDLAPVKVKDGGKLMPVEGSRPVWLGTVRFRSRVMPRASRAENYRIGCLAQIESSVADLF